MDNTNNVKTATIYYTLGSILSASIGFIFIPLYMEKLSVDEYGVFSIVQLIGTISSAVFFFGITSAIIRSYFDYDSIEDRYNCYFTAIVLLVFGSILQVIFGFVFSGLLSEVLFEKDIYEYVIVINVASSALMFVNYGFLTFYRLNNQPKKFFICSILMALLQSVFTILFVVIYELGLYGIVLGSLVAQTCLILFFIVSMFKVFSGSRFIVEDAKILFHFGMYVVLSSFSGLAIQWSDQFIINRYLSLEDVAVYSISVKFASVLTIAFINPFVQVFNPIIMENLKKNTSYFIDIAYRKYLLFGTVFICMLSFFIEEFLYIFDSNGNYSDSMFFLLPILYSLFCYGLINITGIGFIIKRRMKENAMVYFIMAIVNVALNIVLIPVFYIWGAVVSTFFTYLISVVILGFFSNRYISFKIPISFTAIVILFLVAFYYINVYFILGSDIEVRFVCKLIFCTFLVFLFRARVFSEK